MGVTAAAGTRYGRNGGRRRPKMIPEAADVDHGGPVTGVTAAAGTRYGRNGGRRRAKMIPEAAKGQ